MLDHKQLVERAERWLLKTKGCGFVLTELCCYSDTGEIPDAIGWRHNESYLIECKASRSDFFADGKKIFRARPYLGMGDYRYYMCNPEVITQKDLPARWGLLYVYPRIVKVIVRPWKQKEEGHEFATSYRERPLLISALRRVHLRGDLKKIYKDINDV